MMFLKMLGRLLKSLGFENPEFNRPKCTFILVEYVKKDSESFLALINVFLSCEKHFIRSFILFKKYYNFNQNQFITTSYNNLITLKY